MGLGDLKEVEDALGIKREPVVVVRQDIVLDRAAAEDAQRTVDEMTREAQNGKLPKLVPAHEPTMARIGEERYEAREHIRKLRGALMVLAADERNIDTPTAELLRNLVRDSIRAMPDLADRE